MKPAFKQSAVANPLVEPMTGKSPLNPQVAEKLLDLLSSDDRFRELFKSDPLAALIEAGHELAPKSAGGNDTVQFMPELGCLLTGQLASKEEIAESRDLLRSYLASSGAFAIIFAFESGQVSTTLSRKHG